MISYIYALVVGLFVIGLDQFTKYLIINNLEMYGHLDFIKSLIDITYVTNNGGAWNFLGGSTLVLIIITSVVMGLCLVVLIRLGKKSKLLFWALTLVISGGLGNLIDRVFRGGNVVDFLQFAFWKDFPVFNVADCAVVIGAGMLILYFVLDIINDAKIKKQMKRSVETDECN